MYHKTNLKKSGFRTLEPFEIETITGGNDKNAYKLVFYERRPENGAEISLGSVELTEGNFDEETGQFVSAEGSVYSDFQACVDQTAEEEFEKDLRYIDSTVPIIGPLVGDVIRDISSPDNSYIDEAAEICAGPQDTQNEN